MLVLARKANQSIVIGEDIRIVVLGINGDRVRLGIEAPSDVSIIREEIIDGLRRDNDDPDTLPADPPADPE